MDPNLESFSKHSREDGDHEYQFHERNFPSLRHNFHFVIQGDFLPRRKQEQRNNYAMQQLVGQNQKRQSSGDTISYWAWIEMTLSKGGSFTTPTSRPSPHSSCRTTRTGQNPTPTGDPWPAGGQDEGESLLFVVCAWETWKRQNTLMNNECYRYRKTPS